jgi:hypothetical protein
LGVIALVVGDDDHGLATRLEPRRQDLVEEVFEHRVPDIGI